ncbi:MAG TPA: NUDIX domain-containing protein [Streptosporangiaceae bacterium]|nr:NUDIX domain-containing protein [Streptosporangiaceae bacterium]
MSDEDARRLAGAYSPDVPVPPHVAELRAHIGHALLWLATARTVTIDDHGHIIPGRYPGVSTWTIPGGVIDPGEQPADAAVRECCEETGIIAVPEALTSITVSGLVTHDSGDLTRHLDITFRCRATGGQPRPGDGEFQHVRWHRVDALPPLPAYEHAIITRALRDSNQLACTFSGFPQAFRHNRLPTVTNVIEKAAHR